MNSAQDAFGNPEGYVRPLVAGTWPHDLQNTILAEKESSHGISGEIPHLGYFVNLVMPFKSGGLLERPGRAACRDGRRIGHKTSNSPFEGVVCWIQTLIDLEWP